MDAELERHPAGVADAVPHALGELQVMPVARNEVAAGLGDADDRPAGLELRAREAVVQVSLQIERRHLGIARVVEPQAASQWSLPVVAHHGEGRGRSLLLS
jgi:hypothetical protein